MDEKFEERTGEYEEREDHRLKHAGAIALFLLSPVFSYVMFEFVTGNFVMVLPKNAVLNIVWMFALYLLVFGISGSTRISVPVSSVILYAISLAEAFVVSFRSRPIMMGDVLAVKTAMTVAGSYDYTPTFMMIICGVLLIIWNALAQFVFVRVKGKKKRAAVFSVSAGAVAAFIACFYNFMISGLSLEVHLWDPMTSYAENGYILSSAISIKYLVKKAPGGYSQFYSDVELLRQTSMDARSINANFFTGTDADSEQSISLNRLVESSFPLSYGGINNSAVKTVAKLIWESFGMETAKHFLTASNVFDMPIQAFHQVSIGASPLALVPSVYALRADGKKNKAYWPLEGAPAIPSYICAGTSVPKDALFAVIEKLRGPRFSHFYTTNGCLYSCAPADPLPDLSFLEGSRTNRGLLVPSESFLNSLPAETFYKMYHRVFPAGS